MKTPLSLQTLFTITLGSLLLLNSNGFADFLLKQHPQPLFENTPHNLIVLKVLPLVPMESTWQPQTP